MEERLKLGKIYKIEDADGFIGYGVYMGKQKEFECCICGYGNNCKTFNILHGTTIEEGLVNLRKGDYETFGYGNEHFPTVKETEFTEDSF